MRIVNILGGLGNQMFQYALAVALQAAHPKEAVRIDPSGFKGYPLHNGYELKRIFDVKIPEASFMEQMSVYYPLRNYRMWQIGNKVLPKRSSMMTESADMRFAPEVLSSPRSLYYLGYWQTEKYFKDVCQEILEAFAFSRFSPDSPNEKLAEHIAGKNTVSIHIRRGDYLKIGNTQGICTLEYYKKAIDKLKEYITPELFLVFSDDIQWCRDNLADSFGEIHVRFVDWNRGDESYRDMQLMSLCSHNIIANSSFSWWGAWLNNNPDKIVITPSRWMNGEGWVDIIPDNWIKIGVK